jgi:hypothetical protein
MAQQFFYDGQIRRFITQFIRIISNFDVEFGKDRNGHKALQRVPVIYGDQSRQAASIIRGNSENALMNVPAIAVYVSALDYDRERLQEPTFVSKLNLRERAYDHDTGQYLDQQGDTFTVERLMPVPYKLTMKVDIWTSNTEQKLQIFEQFATLFNPGLEIQSTDNYIDWTSLSVVFLDSTNWDSRTVPTGAEEAISILTMQFSMPIWISTPAKVKKLGVVQRVLNNVYDSNGNIIDDAFSGSGSWLSSRAITLLNYGVLYSGNSLKLLEPTDQIIPEIHIRRKSTWEDLITEYGTLVNGTTQVRLQMTGSHHEIIGTVAYHPADPTQLLFTPFPDTLPANTIDAVDAIIDPFNVDVDQLNLLTPATGTRYLITNPIGNWGNNEGAVAWGGVAGAHFVANENDIIEYNGSHWTVAFNSEHENSVQYVTNLNTNVQYEWSNNQWTKSVEGIYGEGEWRIVL